MQCVVQVTKVICLKIGFKNITDAEGLIYRG